MKSRKITLFVIAMMGLLLFSEARAQERGVQAQPPQEETTKDGAGQDGRPPYLLRASRLVLIGAEIKTLKGEDLGVVEDLLIDALTGEVRYVVISADGFVAHHELMAVPAGAFKIDRSKGTLVLDVSRDVLGQAPSFKRGEWPDVADNDWSRSVDNYYHAREGQKEAKVLD